MKRKLVRSGTRTTAGARWAALVWLALPAATPAAPVIYEPFDQALGNLAGKAAGTGLSGNWANSAGTFLVSPGNGSWGMMPVRGNRVAIISTAASAASAAVGAGTLGSLLDDDANLWFSFVWDTSRDFGTNPDQGFALGTAILGSGNNLPIAAGEQAIGVTFKNGVVRGTFWNGSFATRGTGASLSTRTRYLIVGKITWGASNETIRLYLPDANLTINEASPADTYTTTTNLTQSAFDTLCFAMKGDAGNEFWGIDEIRFGATYADVVPDSSTTRAFWDLNGTTAGAGAAPAGTWDASSPYWNSDATGGGGGGLAAWAAGQTAVFSAGTDANNGVYAVTGSGTSDIGGMHFKNGAATLTDGTALRLVGDTTAGVDLGLTATIATPLSEDATSRNFTKEGAGTLVLAGTNTYSGETRLDGGTLRPAKTAALPGYDSPGKVVFNGGTLAIPLDGVNWTTAHVDTLLANATKSYGLLGIDTAGGDLTQWTAFAPGNLGPVGLAKLGANTLTLDQVNSYTGPTTINGGKLKLQNPGSGLTQTLGGMLTLAGPDVTLESDYNSPSSGNLITTFGPLATRLFGNTANIVCNGGTLGTDNKINLTQAAGFVNRGVYFNGADFAWMNAANGYVRAPNYGVDATATNADSIVNGTHCKLTTSSIATPVAGLLSLKLDGGGVGWTLPSATTLIVPTILKAGGGAAGIISGGNGVRASGPELVIRTDTASDTLSIQTVVDNPAGTRLVKSGAGALLITGTNPQTGDTYINGGRIQLDGSSARFGSAGTYNGNIFMAAGTFLIYNGGPGNQTLGGVISGDGSLRKAGNRALILTQANTFSGDTTILAGFSGALTLNHNLALQNSALDVGSTASSPVSLGAGVTAPTLGGLKGSLDLAAVVTVGYASVNALTLNPGAGAAPVYSGIIADGVSGMTLTKTGLGTQTLAGANSYSGATTVRAGTLLVNSPGSLSASSAVSVPGGTLGGNGNIDGSVTVGPAGSLAPGASAGTLSILGALDISASAAGAGKLYFELDATNSSDKIILGGTLTLGSGVLGFSDFVFTDLGGLAAGTYKLITSGGISGSLNSNDLSGAIGALTGTVQITSNDLELVVTGGGGCVTPTAFNVTGGGAYCSGDAGVAVGLDGSESGVDYQLYRNGGATTVGSPVAGTGSAISLGTQTVADTYTVVGTRVAGGCTNTMSGSATVTVSTPATADAGPDQSVNHNTNVTLAGAIGGSASSASWSGGGGSYAPDANTLSAVYTPSAAEKLAGTVTLTLTTDDPGGPCGAAADAVTITLTNTPPVASNFTLGVQQGGTTSVTIIAGKYDPSDADGDPLTVTAADLVTPANGGSVSVVGGTAVTYVASGSFSGTDTFTYVVSDGFGGSDTGTVTVVVSPAAGGLNITGISVVSGVTVRVTAMGVAGATYRLQYTDSLSPVSWQAVVGSDQVAGTNGVMTLLHTDNGAVPPVRYYSTLHVSGP